MQIDVFQHPLIVMMHHLLQCQLGFGTGHDGFHKWFFVRAIKQAGNSSFLQIADQRGLKMYCNHLYREPGKAMPLFVRHCTKLIFTSGIVAILIPRDAIPQFDGSTFLAGGWLINHYGHIFHGQGLPAQKTLQGKIKTPRHPHGISMSQLKLVVQGGLPEGQLQYVGRNVQSNGGAKIRVSTQLEIKWFANQCAALRFTVGVHGAIEIHKSRGCKVNKKACLKLIIRGIFVIFAHSSTQILKGKVFFEI